MLEQTIHDDVSQDINDAVPRTSRSPWARSRKRSNSWTAEDVAALRSFAAAGLDVKTIAIRLRRTESSIKNKTTMHGISVARRQCRNAV
jgi:hypothetical protein